MTSILKYSCLYPDCGRKFESQSKLDEHIKRRHPEFNKKLNPIQNKPPLNLNITSSNQSKYSNNNYKTAITEEKEKKLIDNFIKNMKTVENIYEKEGKTLHEQSTLPNIPNYDKMYDDDEEDNKYKKQLKNSLSSKNIPQNKNEINEITDALIFRGTKYEYYDEITSLNLSRKKLVTFLTNNSVPFDEFENCVQLNISNNSISYSYDIRFFKNLKIVDISNNLINEISFVEFLPNLEQLNCENNNIENITNLMKVNNLTILKLFNNKIKYHNSSIRTLEILNKLEELTIKENPFLNEIINYRQLFIYKFNNIKKLDRISITERERENSKKFVTENNPLYKNNTNRPESSRPIVKVDINNFESMNNNENNNDNNNNEDKNKINEFNDNQIKYLNNLIEIQKEEINKKNKEIEHLKLLNENYERIANNYKKQIKKEEIYAKLQSEIDIWKNAYKDLLFKNKEMELNNENIPKKIRPQTAIISKNNINLFEDNDNNNSNNNDDDNDDIKNESNDKNIGDIIDEDLGNLDDLLRQSFSDLKLAKMRLEQEENETKKIHNYNINKNNIVNNIINNKDSENNSLNNSFNNNNKNKKIYLYNNNKNPNNNNYNLNNNSFNNINNNIIKNNNINNNINNNNININNNTNNNNINNNNINNNNNNNFNNKNNSKNISYITNSNKNNNTSTNSTSNISNSSINTATTNSTINNSNKNPILIKKDSLINKNINQKLKINPINTNIRQHIGINSIINNNNNQRKIIPKGNFNILNKK